MDKSYKCRNCYWDWVFYYRNNWDSFQFDWDDLSLILGLPSIGLVAFFAFDCLRFKDNIILLDNH
jgi:hypothetical protein